MNGEPRGVGIAVKILGVLGGQDVVRARLVELGISQESFGSGEAGSVFMVLGHVVGLLMDHNVEPGKILGIMRCESDLEDRQDIPSGRRVQIENFASFGRRQLWAIVRTGDIGPALAFLVDMFIRGVQAGAQGPA